VTGENQNEASHPDELDSLFLERAEGGKRDPWSRAREIAQYAVQVPTFLTGFIRVLRSDKFKGERYRDETTRNFIRRLISSSSIRHSCYHSARLFRPERLGNTSEADLTTEILQDCFTGEELSGIVALMILHRRILRGADKELKESLSTHIHSFTEAGAYVGSAVPAIGFTRGLLTGGLRAMGTVVLMRADPQDWSRYRKKLKQKRLPFDLSLEDSYWGCNHVQLGSILLQMIGLGATDSVAFTDALGTRIDSHALTQPGIIFRQTDIWIQSLMRQGQPPHVVHNAEFYPIPAALDSLLSQVDSLRLQGSTFPWLDKTIEKIVSTTPQTTDSSPAEDWYENPQPQVEQELMKEIEEQEQAGAD
jgi:hypothetical protein